MGKEEVGFIGQKVFGLHFFNAKKYITVTEVFLYFYSCQAVFTVAVAAVRRSLDDHLNIRKMLLYVFAMARSEGYAVVGWYFSFTEQAYPGHGVLVKRSEGNLIFAAMNYFELFGIPVTLSVEQAKLKQRFYQLSREFHPDFHSQSGEEQQEEMLGKSADLNRAYKVFQTEDATIRYVLMMKGLMEEEEKIFS